MVSASELIERLAQTVLDGFRRAMPEDTALVLELAGVSPESWTVDRGVDEIRVYPRRHPQPDCRVSCRADDFVQLANGELHPETAFREGRVVIEGDVGLAIEMHRELAAGYSKSHG